MTRFLVLLAIFFAGGLSLLVGFARAEDRHGAEIRDGSGMIGAAVADGS
jgi:hypothetical protein